MNFYPANIVEPTCNTILIFEDQQGRLFKAKVRYETSTNQIFNSNVCAKTGRARCAAVRAKGVSVSSLTHIYEIVQYDASSSDESAAIDIKTVAINGRKFVGKAAGMSFCCRIPAL